MQIFEQRGEKRRRNLAEDNDTKGWMLKLEGVTDPFNPFFVISHQDWTKSVRMWEFPWSANFFNRQNPFSVIRPMRQEGTGSARRKPSEIKSIKPVRSFMEDTWMSHVSALMSQRSAKLIIECKKSTTGDCSRQTPDKRRMNKSRRRRWKKKNYSTKQQRQPAERIKLKKHAKPERLQNFNRREAAWTVQQQQHINMMNSG